jgi:hypothetical protein
MRTRTFKWRLVIAVAVVAFGLSLAGCSSSIDQSYIAGPNGLDIRIQGYSRYYTTYIITTADNTLTIDSWMSSPLSWYYDVPEDQLEYVIVNIVGQNLTEGYIHHIQIHKLASKKPANFDD